MAHVIGIRRETKSNWERRTPITPDLVRRLVHQHDLEVLVQPSPRRVFSDGEFVHAGAKVTSDLSGAKVVFGVKEIPTGQLDPDTTYVFFAHVIKGQPYNMAMLRRLMEQRCTLIDYEKVADAQGRRLIFFGRYAGLAGMVDTLWALGQRLAARGIATAFAELEPAHAYESLDEAKAAVRAAGRSVAANPPAALAPLVIGVAGYGNVARGAQEILHELPHEVVEPEDLEARGRAAGTKPIRVVTFREPHLVEPRDPDRSFDLQHYYANGGEYRSKFARHLPHLSVLVNCNYWDDRYPRLVTKSELAALWAGAERPRLEVIGDLGCDIGGAVECTEHATDPSDPVFVWEPAADLTHSGFEGDGPAVLAIDILPAELPRDASEEFARSLGRFVPAIARADYSVPFPRLDLPPEIKGAVVVHRGELTPAYGYIARHLDRG